jgi:hypothetical protein
MSSKSFVHVVCSPRPRVGKTLLARLLVDYFLANERPVMAFDTNPYEPALAERFPGRVTRADIQTVQGQVTLFDSLLAGGEAPGVIDLWHRSFDPFFDLVEQIGFIDEARSKSISTVIFFLDTSDADAVDAHARLRERFEGLTIVSVRNGATNPMPYAPGYRPNAPVTYPTETHLQMPALDPILRRAIDGPGFSLSGLLRAPPQEMSIVVRAGLRAWVSKIFLQFQNFELRLSLSEAEYLR